MVEEKYIIYCDDITGILGELLANDVSFIPKEAVKHLQDAYMICAKELCSNYIDGGNNMILYFKNCRGKIRKIGKVDGRMTPEKIRAEVDRQIKAFCDERNFTIYYTRVWNEELNGKMMTKFDVGSHTEFFYVYPECWDKYRQTVKAEQVI